MMMMMMMIIIIIIIIFILNIYIYIYIYYIDNTNNDTHIYNDYIIEDPSLQDSSTRLCDGACRKLEKGAGGGTLGALWALDVSVAYV